MLASRQQTYWWHRARRAMALSLLRRYGLARGSRWVDIGCGPGGNLHLLDAMQPSAVVGVDLSAVALELAAKNAPAATLVSADLNDRLPFDDASFDVATIFNVLYHQWVNSESAVLSEIHRIVRPGGLLLLTEPAFNALRRALDDAVMTRRRYHLDDFKTWLIDAGFQPLFGSYFTSFGFPLLIAAKALRGRSNPENKQTSPDMKPMLSPINSAFLGAASLENFALTRGVSIPFGTTLVWVARRRS
jgi:SAM-dependent methyltransferase